MLSLPPWPKRPFTSIFIFSLGFSVYLALAQLGLAIATVNEVTSPVWPAAGFAAAYLSYFGRRFLFPIFLASLVSDWLIATPLWAAFGIAFTNTTSALICCFILQKFPYPNFKSSNIEFNTLHHLSGIFLLCTVPPFFGACSGSVLLALCGIAPWSEFSITWLTWWLGDSLGILMVFPIFLDLFRQGTIGTITDSIRPLKKILLVVFCFGLSILISYFIFDTHLGRPYTFLIFPLLLLGGVTLGTTGLNTIIVTLSAYATYATSLGKGPFSWSSLSENLIALQIFLFSVGITAIVLRIFGGYLRNRVVLAILTCGWLLSGSVFYIFYSSRHHIDQSHFRALISESEDAIRRRVQSYENILNSGLGLFLASDTVTSKDWKTYVQTIDLRSRNIGAYGLGYIANVKKTDLPEYIRQQRSQNSNFHIKKVPKTDLIYELPDQADDLRIVQFLEPRISNRFAIGLNVGSENRRRRSQNMARDTGVPTISEDIFLVQEEKKHKGFLFYAPLYAKNTVNTTVDQRRQNIQGWVYAPFTYRSLLNEIRPEITKQVEFFLFSQDDLSPNGLLFGSTEYKPEFFVPDHSDSYSWNQISIGHRKYSILWEKGADFVTSQNATLPWIGVFGTFLTLAATWIHINGVMYRKRAEVMVQLKTKELSERELLWRTLMETIPAGVLQMDDKGKIRFVNSRWLKMTGKDLEGTVGQHWIQVAHPNDISQIERTWNSTLEKRSQFEMQFRILNTENELRWTHTIVSPITNATGESLGHVGIQIDTTDRVRIQQQREEEQIKLAQSSKMASLGEMAGGIAHEINNPLAIIFGKSAQLKKLLISQELNRDRLLEGLNKIESTVDRIARIVKGLRSFSRDSENDPMEKISISQVIEDSLALSAERLGRLGIEVKTEIEEASILGRPAQISQILVNLLSNSFDAIESLSEKWIKIESRVRDQVVEIYVSDSGKGIPVAIQQKLAQPFFTTKGVGKGTGLGLSISKQIAENHGGSLKYELRHEHTSFKIELPLLS